MKSLFLILFPFLIIPPASSQALPAGYILQYGQKFISNKGLGDFWFSSPDKWGISRLQGNYYLQFNHSENADSLVTSLPPNRAILKNSIFGDFVLEVDAMPVAPEAADREICFFLGLKDSTKYYFILLSTDPVSEMQGIYLVKNSNRRQLPLTVTSSGSLMPNAWQKIRIERNIVKRTIRVFAGNMEQPLMEVKDYELVMGSVGFGSINSPANFDNISIWAPTMIQEGDQ